MPAGPHTTLDEEVDPTQTTLPGVAPRGATMGRYVVLDRLGAGGMGVVYAAYDPKLDRRVALKLLHRGANETRSLREAQALARLSHPNVIAVHDVGTLNAADAPRMGLASGEHVFVAMEYVDGETLTQWLAAQTRDWSQILDVLMRAGTGLAAAHDAGLIHRDFKPDNVMVGTDGRVRVMDFGLARSEGSLTPDAGVAGDDPAIVSSGELLSSPLTKTGAILGTPAYMAPEQHRGIGADARSDQFAFCVTAHEALYGLRPFAGKTIAAIVLAIGKQDIVDVPVDSKVPRAVRRTILRGLATEPAARWSTMSVLLERLNAKPNRQRTVLSAAGLAVGLAGVGAFMTRGDAQADPCATAGDEIAATWNDDRRHTIATAFSAVGRRYADDVWQRVEPTLDEYAGEWKSTRQSACRATHVAGTQSDRLLDLRMACLDRRRTQLDALLGQFENVDAGLARRATSSAAALVPVATCSDAEHLQAPLPLPDEPERRTAVEAVRERLDELAGLLWAGRYKDAARPAAETVNAARQTAYAPVIAEALLAHGRTLASTHEPNAADVLHEAILAASQGHHDDVAVEAWARLVKLSGGRQGNFAQALAWARAGEAAAIRAGDDPNDRLSIEIARGEALLASEDRTGAEAAFGRARVFFDQVSRPDTTRYARMLVIEGIVLSQNNKMDASERSFREALALYEEIGGPMHPSVASVANNLGTQLMRLKRLDEAQALFERAITIEEAAQGPDSPELLGALLGLSSLHKSRRHLDKAREYAERARQITTAAYGDEHPSTAFALERLGEILAVADPPAAIAPLRRALKIRTTLTSADHVTTTWARLELANAYGQMGDYRKAIAELEQVAPIIETAHGPDAENLGKPYVLLSEYCRKDGQLAAAKVWAHKSLTVYTAVFGDDSRDLSYPRMELARIARAEGDLDEAVAQLGQVIELRQNANAPAPDVASAMRELAQVHAMAGRTADARRWGGQAQALLATVAKTHAADLETLQRWLSDLPAN